jgi:hypothetical protein
MKRNGFHPEQIAPADAASRGVVEESSLKHSIVVGGIGFCLASLLVFATVAYGEGWMYSHLGLAGAYVTWTLLFILLGGAAFLPLLNSGGRWLRFYLLFGAAFLFYAIGWVGAYFTLRGKLGEWAGSFAGSILMGLVFALGFGALRNAAKFIAVLFVANTLGYFLGDALNNWLGGRAGMLSWGAAFGLFLGSGIGATLYWAQTPRPSN